MPLHDDSSVPREVEVTPHIMEEAKAIPDEVLLITCTARPEKATEMAAVAPTAWAT